MSRARIFESMENFPILHGSAELSRPLILFELTSNMPEPPPSVKGIDGKRIRLIFGENGDSYLLILDEDNGDQQWQTQYWSNIPYGLAKQINNMVAKGRYVKDVHFSPDGRWFVNGRKRDGSGGHSWWGGCYDGLSSAINKMSGKGERLQVSFGYERDQAFL